ncbi:hypothetical protein [Microbacterium sp. CFBP9034]|uniref:hypothetical protein n=1 Tax=Microbacterium sp. CFBP9034 TaxID=3096540 RepID=UPI002A6A1EF8|nr:hypothetical protein [Microbacterium sp. CFBP9034]MDY0909602.1 hypothetical protein [Microbacterium sp. CFBP9034]
MPRSMRVTGLVLAVGLGAALSACATSGAPGAGPSVPDEIYDCQGTPIAASVIANEPSLDSLSAAGEDAVASASFEGIDPLEIDEDEGWFVGSEEAETIVLLRAVDPADSGGETYPSGDREMLTIGYIGDATNLDPGWYVIARSTCSLRVDIGALGVAELELDPDAEADAASTEVALLVTEQACNSGEDAAGRIEVVRLVETGTTVEVILGVEPRGGAHTCQENPQTPFTLELAAPLGDRTLLDASLVPARQLSPAPES